MISLFRTAPDLMVQYAHYHRDRRNILTHLVGIPLIVLSIGMMLSLISFDIAGNTITLAGLLWVLSTAWYLTRGNWLLGLATSMVNGKPWNKTPPAPRLPREVIEKTSAKYEEALQRLTR